MFQHSHAVALAFLLASAPLRVDAGWPFQSSEPSSNKVEGLVNVGALGLEGVSGTIAAFGDWNGDQSTDIFALSSDKRTLQIHLWNHKKAKYRSGFNLTTDDPIESVIPLDFNLDGHLDVLVWTQDQVEDGGWWGTKRTILNGKIYLGGGEKGGFQTDPISVDSITTVQPTIIDSTGRLRPDYLASPSGSKASKLQLFQNTLAGFNATDLPFNQPEKLCTLAEPHSNAYIDLNGDCLPDRDGTIDLVFPTCASHSSASGIGKTCSINIAYDKQKPLCSSGSSSWLSLGQLPIGSAGQQCRSLEQLCAADTGFNFDLNPDGDSFTSTPVSSLLPGTTSLLFSQPSRTSKLSPLIPLRVGDFDNDGFPDILASVVNATAVPAQGGIFESSRSKGVQIRLLQNVECTKKDKADDGACANGKYEAGRRKFKVVTGPVTDALSKIWDARGAAWLDIDENGTLDIVIMRSGKQDGQKTTFIKNNMFHDAFFLKALVLNGACGDQCEPTQGSKRYSPYGAVLPGVTFKFSTLTASGQRVPSQVSQLSQTSYLALQTPYSYFGLGRINNYVENLFVGTSLHSDIHYTNIEGVIPNSHVVLIPPFPDVGNETLSVKPNEDWHKSLFLHPGDWIKWVITVLIVVVILLAGVIYLLHQNEKVSRRGL
ncbi:hypothetical protein QFC20_002167 [Naganishia adeliensis]|uniref:Uncharacterized protein n=1 Tax=Naganishia adeliensis TaxID=92952 RepID=A0ACC2WM66_9TREE|nr:hypothetical protein QFC20_002167 [Naganishia adeliensis]